ncbi:hypothetical protein [Paenibacillus flagellatus]|uniref:Uncharacterized protein n=1 Tax=Paenibacillus flagellatus TaxID=2211139 RepID=A0A2V5L3E3_9BACL|nr:hypothetical protein [Paenibacillus flagellatus]PYI57336.1 hypothetical protein DLM86_02540 [Paenibacillus flagellatus]
MKLGAMWGITLLAAAVFLWDWPRWSRMPPKQRAAFAAMTALGWGLGVWLAFDPKLPGPTQLIDSIFAALGKTLE